MRDTSVFLPLESYYQRTGLRASIVLCQLPLTISLLLIVALAAVFSPATLNDARFMWTLLAHGLIFAACIAAPWTRLPAGSFTVIPILDCLAVGLTRDIGGPVLSVVGLLMAFPVIWLAVSTSKTRVALAILTSCALR